jgi:hypothetical protein
MKSKKPRIGLIIGTSIAIVAIAVCIVTSLLLFFSDADESGWQKIFLAFRDPFYVGAGESAFTRIPLIKPYEAIDMGKNDWWVISLLYDHKGNDLLGKYSNIGDVTKIAVENGQIMGFTPQSDNNRLVNWFVLIPDKKIELGFADKADFLKYIQSYGLKEPNWITLDEAYQQFKSTGCLDWIPDCKK